MTLDERDITSGLLYFRSLVVKEEIEECKLKKQSGCFPSVSGVIFECPDIDTCPESSK